MKKIIIPAAAALILLLVLLILFVLPVKEGRAVLAAKPKGVVLTDKEKVELSEALKKSDGIKKKNKGKEGDTTGAAVTAVSISGNVLNLEKREFLKLKMTLSDESGIYRVRVLFYHNNNLIGYMQQNPNRKDKTLNVEFDINERTILEDSKTFIDYEGAEISYAVRVWDNNMNMQEYKGKSSFYVFDNIPPEKIKAYWTVFYNEKGYDIEIYTNKTKTSFDIYKIRDLPLLEENIITKYEYGYTGISGGNLLLRVGMDDFEGEKKEVEIDTGAEGKYQFFIKAYDRKNNVSEKKIKFYIDTTPPSGRLSLEAGSEFFLGETVYLSMNASDNLSGVARYRLAGSETDIFSADWKEYKQVSAKFIVPSQEGFYAVWAQLEDNAFNVSKPFKIDFYAKRKTTIDINAVDKDKEKVIGIDREKMEKGTMEIKKMEEK